MLSEQLEILRSGDEKTLRELNLDWPDSVEELNEVIKALTERQHDYGTCVYAMSIAAEATFNFVAQQLGVTGFQAGAADLDIVRRTRGFKGPFALIDASNLLYPQYDIRRNVEELLVKWQPWAKEQAEQRLAEKSSTVAPHVEQHWRELAAENVQN